jgi:hypothetical protein
MYRTFRPSILPVLGAFLLSQLPPLHAQSIFATIVGTVTDSSFAVLTGATVTVINAGTNEKRSFTTNDAGVYEISNLFPGTYSLEITAAGFTKYRNERIELASKQVVRLDVKLEVSGQVSEITVSGGAGATIETETAKLSDVRNLQQLQTLPMAARSVYRFLVLTPGVTGGMNGTMSVSGSGGRQVHYAVDGVTMSDVRSSNTIGPTLNFMEAFEEVKIDFGNNSAEFKGIGTLDVATKRGGNKLHGSVYDYYGTGAFLARDYFTRARSGTPTHGFGGSVSGPAYFPNLYNGKDKTFWFASYETTFAPEGVSNLTPSVPLTAWKQGDFSGQSAIRWPVARHSRTASSRSHASAMWPNNICRFGRTPISAPRRFSPARTSASSSASPLPSRIISRLVWTIASRRPTRYSGGISTSASKIPTSRVDCPVLWVCTSSFAS